MKSSGQFASTVLPSRINPTNRPPAPTSGTARTRVVMIHQFGGRGGASIMLAHVIAALDRRRFDVTVICPPGDAAGLFREAGATVVEPPRPIDQFMHISGFSRFALHPRFLWTTGRIAMNGRFWRDYISGFKPGIIHLNAITLAPMARSLRPLAPVVCLVQETAVRGLLGLRTAWLRHLLSTSMDAVVFISDYDRRQAQCRAPFVQTIPNWVDLPSFDRQPDKSAARRALGIGESTKVILMMGGISPIKGTLPLIQAFDRLQIDDRLLLIGGYHEAPDRRDLPLITRLHLSLRRVLGLDYHERVLSYIEKRGLRDRIRFAGMVKAVAPLYAAADIVVFPAAAPHQARPVLEAGAMGRPVVVSGFENLREFVQDGVNGLTAVPGSVESLAAAMERLLTEPALARRLGEANYEATLRNHHPTENAKRMAAVFDTLAERCNPANPQPA